MEEKWYPVWMQLSLFAKNSRNSSDCDSAVYDIWLMRICEICITIEVLVTVPHHPRVHTEFIPLLPI